MNENQNTKEKVCSFYASDYHFEMMSLPYIEKKIESNKEVVILTETNLEDTIKTLLARTNLSNDKKEKILKVNWKNDDFNKFKKIKGEINKEKDLIVFIKGNENYIKNINENIEKWLKNDGKIKIIDCYDIEEIGENINSIMDQYKKVLNTTGEKDIQKI